MANFGLSRNGEESFNKYLSPDPGHLRGGPSYGDNTSRVKKIKSIGAIVFQLRTRTDRQTNKHTQMHYPRTPLQDQGKQPV